MRALKASLWLLSLLVCSLLFAAFVFVARPGLFINSRTAAFALHRFGGAYRPRWRELKVELASPGLLRKRLVVEAADFCADARDRALRGCVPRARLDASFVLGRKPLLLVTRVDELTLHAEKVALDSRGRPPAPAVEKKKRGRASLTELVPAPLRGAKLGKLDVSVRDFVSISTGGSLAVDARAAYSAASSAPLTAEAFVVRAGTAPHQRTRYDASLLLDSDVLREGHLSYLSGRAKVRGGAHADLDARIEGGAPGELSGRLEALFKAGGRTLTAALRGRRTTRELAAKGSFGLSDPAGRVRETRLDDCRLSAPLDPDSGRPRSADLACAVRLRPAPFGGARGARLKSLAGRLRLKTDFTRDAPGGAPDSFASDLTVRLGPADDFYHFFANLHAKLSGRLGRLPESLKSEHELDAGFRVDRFEEIVDFLKGTAFAVPAPINVLQGPVAFSLKTSGPTRGADHAFDYAVRTRLSSGRQKLFARVDGRLIARDLFGPKRKLSSRTEVMLDETEVELPYLKITQLPTVKVDKRIKTGDPKRDAAVQAQREAVRGPRAPEGEHELRLRTGKPIMLRTNLNKDPIPIALDLLSRASGMEGQVRLEPFKLELFKQQARVEHITLTHRPGSKAQGLDGKIVYKRSDVRVDILLLGTTEKPQVEFQSDPPMSRNEIVAVLFYGKSPGELDSDQQATVGNASVGMANGAFGVLSLYLLAATPIDFIGYDPATQTYQARFKLPGGATLAVGADLEESRTLTLRKRIVKNVEIETGVRRTVNESNAVTTFLQWFRRY